MGNPFAPRTRRDAAPSFPEGRFRRIGMTDDEVVVARARWDELTADEAAAAAESIAALTDDELLADLEDQREATVLEGLAAWASAAVDAGDYASTDAALDMLEDLLALDDDVRAALLEVAPGGPGEAVEVSPDGKPEGGTDPSTDGDAAVVADARARIADGTPPSRLLRWMGTDRTRAAALLVAETERPEPRVAVTSGARAVLDA